MVFIRHCNLPEGEFTMVFPARFHTSCLRGEDKPFRTLHACLAFQLRGKPEKAGYCFPDVRIRSADPDSRGCQFDHYVGRSGYQTSGVGFHVFCKTVVSIFLSAASRQDRECGQYACNLSV